MQEIEFLEQNKNLKKMKYFENKGGKI
jgi:hypothetical protein